MEGLETLRQVRADLKRSFVQRDREVDGLLIGLLARQHVLLLGPPGTAKSLLARRLCGALTDARYFEWLLTKFTTPEEVFGPVDLAALEQGRYQRVTAQKLPEAEVVFLDEIFKANSAILNALLTVLNERRFHQGSQMLEVPLETLVAASNELPEEEELRALLDRFLLRFQVGYVDDAGFQALLRISTDEPSACLTQKDLEQLRRTVDQTEIPDSIIHDLGRVRHQLFAEAIFPSDRRFRLSLDVLRAAAVLQGRTEVVTADLHWLAHVLWTDPEDQPKVEAVLNQLARGFEDEARKISGLAREVFSYAQRDWPDAQSRARAALEAHTKLHELSERLAGMVKEAEQHGRDAGRLSQLRNEIESMQASLLGAAN
ncbi:MAG: AAA family ATPase [Myxococcota bacterium]